MLTAETALALFSMLAISSVSLLIAQRIRIPHTVFLVLIGVVLASLAQIPFLHFLEELTLTPELLFFIFLPTLIFESAYNINVKHLTKDATIIGILAVISLAVSALAIALGLDLAFTWLGLDIPFILFLVFGAIISATDPVAVLALFKEYGAPRRLSLIFEGESIFNDGTAVALFLVLLAIAETGAMGSGDILHGLLSFIIMVIGGGIFGLIFGGFFAKLVGWCRESEFASITLTMVLAHATFICAEIFSHSVTIGGTHIYISSIIATAVASLLMGNYGRYKMPPHASEFVEKYWAQFAFLANSLIFIMIGMLVTDLPSNTPDLILPIVLTILIVAAARALSIYPIVTAFNAFVKKDKEIPRSWQHVLAWGSLRGALAVTMALMIPDALSFPGWDLAYTPKEFVLAVTVGCVFATLFIKATTIGTFMAKLKLSTFTRLEELNFREMLIYIYSSTLQRLGENRTKGYITESTHTLLTAEHQAHIRRAFDDIQKFADPVTLEKAIRQYAIGIERKHVKELFASHEVSEHVIRRIMNKLEYQSDAIEHGDLDAQKYEHGMARDIFEIIIDTLRPLYARKKTPLEKATEEFLYYRALAIISRKVIKELGKLNKCFEEAFAAPHEAIAKVVQIYETYRNGSAKKMEELQAQFPDEFSALDATLTRHSTYKHESRILHELVEREMVTPKVAIALNEHFVKERTVSKH